MNKLKDIAEAGGRKYTEKELMECEGFNRIIEKTQKMDDILFNLEKHSTDSVTVE